jgi:putative metallohydrolase (TIGR04338 family)
MVKVYRGNPMKDNPIDGLQRIFSGPSKPLVTGPPSAPMVQHYRDPFYLAEIQARSTVPDRFLVGPEIHTYIAEVQAMAWPRWQPRAHWPIVASIAATDTPYYHSGKIIVPSPVRELIVLHEIAHHFAGVRVEQHDALFIQAFLDVVAGARNPAAAEHLGKVFTEFGVKW